MPMPLVTTEGKEYEEGENIGEMGEKVREKGRKRGGTRLSLIEERFREKRQGKNVSENRTKGKCV